MGKAVFLWAARAFLDRKLVRLRIESTATVTSTSGRIKNSRSITFAALD